MIYRDDLSIDSIYAPTSYTVYMHMHVLNLAYLFILFTSIHLPKENKIKFIKTK